MEAYFATEATALEKHEYLDGVIRAVPAATPNHARVTSALSELLGPELRRRGVGRFLSGSLQVWIPACRSYPYPDGTVSFPPTFDSRPNAVSLNPKVVFEALSPSTEAYDRGGKFRRYQSLETLEEYVLISTMEPLVEVFARPEWGVKTYEGLDAVAVLNSVGLELPLRELYADLGWDLPA